MRLEDFDFELPPEQVAQAPLEPRDSARLLVLHKSGTGREHRRFSELPALLGPGDLLVVNDARVVPARLLGRKAGTGGRAELLLVRPAAQVASDVALAGAPEALEWVCLGQASKGLKPGQVVELEAGARATVLSAAGEGEYRVRFEAPGGSLVSLLERAGRLPLPPYIQRALTEQDAERYQTVYARARGSVAAPTAGLHFTPSLLEALEARGVRRATVTLDVGPGTFLPVRDADVERHRMHLERFHVPDATVEALEATRRAGHRVVAVGTTVVRTLESATDPGTGRVRAGPGESALFIRPGYTFRQVDALITNFHLPKSTLLMLVSAFLGHAATLAAYRDAVARGYRFFSYGDAMVILP